MKGFLNILYLLVGGCSLAFLFLLLNDNSTNTFVSGTCGVVSTIGCGTTGGFSLDTVSSERLMVLRHKYIKTTSHKFKFSLRGSEM